MLADATGAECGRAGRVKVQPDCSLPGHPEVFVVGDMMNCNNLPGVAEIALQSGVTMRLTSSESASKTAPNLFLGSIETLGVWPPSIAAVQLSACTE
jgi:NADH dehydrogenase FAD-containing subunit